MVVVGCALADTDCVTSGVGRVADADPLPDAELDGATIGVTPLPVPEVEGALLTMVIVVAETLLGVVEALDTELLLDSDAVGLLLRNAVADESTGGNKPVGWTSPGSVIGPVGGGNGMRLFRPCAKAAMLSDSE
jgi:hypothetical protein